MVVNSSSLVGDWTNPQQKSRLRIEEDGRYSLSYPGGEDIRGTWRAVENSLVVVNDSDAPDCPGAEGCYKAKVEEGKLVLSPFNDDCPTRKEHFAAGFSRKEKP
ncbi:hypothetical protein [Desulfohalovibrio reitneri]|uniref:hypothetical protein n=1 Tax=Desulfohalovibrio reitneri TaxID=1307759 RepID=UPI0004A706E4|nr:hypothetical protein [Desulfohalovibrio reitneri]